MQGLPPHLQGASPADRRAQINDLVPGDAQSFMYVVGVIEIIAGVVVAFAPHLGAISWPCGWAASW